MDKISKAIKKIDAKDALKIVSILELLVEGKLSELNIKKLKGHTDIFRVRAGTYRIVFKQTNNKVIILYIGTARNRPTPYLQRIIREAEDEYIRGDSGNSYTGEKFIDHLKTL